MTHRTVPLDLLVRMRDALDMYCDCGVLPMFKAGDFVTELTAQIEQQGHGEPVAWLRMRPDGKPDWAEDCFGERDMLDADQIADGYTCVPVYFAPPATPQDSVPAWALELVAKWRREIGEFDKEHRVGAFEVDGIDRCADELESRALALAQTKG